MDYPNDLNLTEQNYRSHWAYGSTDMKNWRDGYRWFLDGRQTRSSTPSQALGTLAHCLLLEPEKFEERYFGWQEKTRTTKAYKILKEQNLSKIGVTASLYDQAQRLIRPFSSSDILKKARKEVILSGVNFCELAIKGRLDAVYENLIFDFKTTRNLNKFAYSCVDYMYHLQAYHYKSLMPKPSKYYILAVDTVNFHADIFEISGDTLDAGEKEWRNACKKAWSTTKQNENQADVLKPAPEEVLPYDLTHPKLLTLPNYYLTRLEGE